MNVSKQVLAVDFDDVLVELARAIAGFHNEQYGSQLGYEDFVTYHWHTIFGCSVEVTVERVIEFYNSPHHDDLAPVEGAYEALCMLRSAYSLHIVTARPEMLRDRTMRLINRYFPDIFDGFHFTGLYIGAHETRRPKSEVCAAIRAIGHIDDALHHAEDVAKSGCKVLLPDKPWNQGELARGIVRVHSWEEVITHLT